MSSVPECKRILIERVVPALDNGRYAVKCEVGDRLVVRADVFRDGHEKIVSSLIWRKKGDQKWERAPMKCINAGIDLWEGSFIPPGIGAFEYAIEAHCDLLGSWAGDVKKKLDAGQDVASDLLEGIELAKRYSAWLPKSEQSNWKSLVKSAETAKSQLERVAILFSQELLGRAAAVPDPGTKVVSERVFPLWVDRVEARYAAWYELFPRSQGKLVKKSGAAGSVVSGRNVGATSAETGGTFKDVEARLPDIQEMGFNVLYFPPIHPIGHTQRKGPNNSLNAAPGDPGCPYSIGNSDGGHDAIEPGLGSFKDFEHLVKKAREHGMEIALDFAVNCSPDHPYLEKHPDWFSKRPDGTIKYAENPPKKYEDIYPINFESSDREGLWNELKRIFLFWAEKGVRIFRIDNPHTKPFSFWEWVIRDVQEEYPDVLFLAEAFTRPRVMQALGKLGFSQSYTYFTWRNFKQELVEYFTELTTPPMSWYYRGNLFVNTPDILPTFLQRGGRAGFKIRATLAATLSSVYGIYSGFELCENEGIPGKEEYLDSEKYEIKPRDWNKPGNIKSYITTLNRIRRENPALHEYDNLTFYPTENEHVLCYGKSLDENNVLIAVSLDPFQKQHSFVYVPIEKYGIKPEETYQVHDLITDKRYLWKGQKNYIELDPKTEIANVFVIRRWIHREQDFDYFK
ncbi:MAG: alpha-1,4-glucan--maltose-1-phosphate maltosyltransferase [Candidatus Riflebacteria bacterium]|nr:alpha-1,4-glucan--maltose-1-phosphate maltosyltransferase [Candidatus Riflebacteria bacterium]